MSTPLVDVLNGAMNHETKVNNWHYRVVFYDGDDGRLYGELRWVDEPEEDEPLPGDPLDLGIEKWTVMAAGYSLGKQHGVTEGWIDDCGIATCALCRTTWCEFCPVYDYTHSVGCRYTPYEDHHDEADYENYNWHRAYRHAQREAAFLSRIKHHRENQDG